MSIFTKIKGSTPNDNNTLDVEVFAPLKYLSNFWKSLASPLINCETELDLKWTKNCVIPNISKTFRAVDRNDNPVVHEVVTSTTGETFERNNAKLYVPVIRLSIYDAIKFLKRYKARI